MSKALVLFSGGLDSILAVAILQRQGIEVTALSFVSHFFNEKEAEKSVKQLKIPLLVKNIAEEQLAVVKNPKYGYGKGLNPCVDCHGLMFRVAKQVAREKKIDIIASGEVVGQRPFSQNREALRKVEILAGLENRLLRPLSAKLLPKTVYEQEGLVDREKLLDISGRSRQKQLSLVKKFNLKYYPNPAGGCPLTEEKFGLKVKNLLQTESKNKPLKNQDFQSLKIGRHFWPKAGETKWHLILGRSQEENRELIKKAQAEDLLLELAEIPGPTALLRNFHKISNPQKADYLLQKAKKYILKYSRTKSGNPANFSWRTLTDSDKN